MVENSSRINNVEDMIDDLLDAQQRFEEDKIDASLLQSKIRTYETVMRCGATQTLYSKARGEKPKLEFFDKSSGKKALNVPKKKNQ